MHVLPLLLTLLAFGTEASNLQANPIYRELLEVGVEVTADGRVRLPPPTMAEGLDGPGARAAIAGIPSLHVPVDQLVRRSVVAPLVFRFRSVELPGVAVPVHGVDVWYVAYGKLGVFSRKEFLNQFLSMNRRDAMFHVLDAAELAERKIPVESGASRRERYVHSVFPLMDRVELSVTSHICVSHTDDCLVFASALDGRFASDKEFPNWWRPIEREGGRVERGPKNPYAGAGSYLKVTRLADPPGALFAEFHLVFVEPQQWFGGANLLRSKLPILIQSQVRDFRRRLAKASRND